MFIVNTVDDFDPDSVQFNKKAIGLPTGGKFVSFNCNNKTLCVQTNVLNCPFGFVAERDQARKNVTFTVETDNTLFDLMHLIDSYVIDTLMVKSGDWFDKPFNNRIVLEEGIFHKTVKQVKDYPPRISVRMKFQNERPLFGIFDNNQNEMNVTTIDELVELIPRTTKVRLLLVSSCIWYVGCRCGYSWDVYQIQIIEKPLLSASNMKRFMFKDV